MVHICKTYRMYLARVEEIDIIYNGTAAASPMRRLLVDIPCWLGGLDWTRNKDFARNASSGFINDLIDMLMNNKMVTTGVKPWVAD
jgi:hypothetical protein